MRGCFRVYPGAELKEIAIREGAIRSDDDLLLPRFYCSPALDVAWARRVLKRAAIRHAWRGMNMLPVVARLLVSRRLAR